MYFLPDTVSVVVVRTSLLDSRVGVMNPFLASLWPFKSIPWALSGKATARNASANGEIPERV